MTDDNSITWKEYIELPNEYLRRSESDPPIQVALELWEEYTAFTKRDLAFKLIISLPLNLLILLSVRSTLLSIGFPSVWGIIIAFAILIIFRKVIKR